MELTEKEQKIIEKSKAERINAIQQSDLTDSQKANRIELIENEQYVRLKQLTVKEVAPHQWEAY
jgi:hypothetical protein